MIFREIVVLSLVFLVIGGLLWGERIRLYGKWTRSTAVIIKNIYHRNDLALFNTNPPHDDETGAYFPVIQFTTVKKETITKELSIGSYPPRPVGTRMVVMYEINDPNNFITQPRIYLDIIPKILITIGLIGLLLAISEFSGITFFIPNSK
jgi:hypothetical protein